MHAQSLRQNMSDNLQVHTLQLVGMYVTPLNMH